MTIKKGEIIGVTGLMGAGKTELGRAISGVDNLDGGVYIQGKKVRCPTPQAVFVKGWRTFPRTARPWV
jgi:ribose transport system ATP-binding protein